MKKPKIYRLGSDISYRVKRVDINASNKILEKARARLMLTCVFFLLLFLVIVYRMFEVSTNETPTYVLNTPGVHPLELHMQRADILDRNGVVIATSLPVVNLYARPKLLKDAQQAARDLSSIFPELSYDVLIARLSQDKNFVYIKRNLTPDEQYEVNKLGNPALNFEKSEKRVYPQGRLFSHVVGFVDIDNNGMSGIEYSFNRALQESNIPLRLSLDVAVQDAVRVQLKEAMDLFGAEDAIAAVINVNNGEILSLVSLPDFDSNNISSTPQNHLFNKATLGVYETGSVFKLFNTAMALESGKIKPTDSFDATKPMTLGKHTIKDFYAKNKWLNVEDILVHSSNIGSARMALLVGGDGQQEFLENLGFFAELPLEIGEKAKPLRPSIWRDINVATISYGYGLAVSPMHVLIAMSAMVNGGLLYSPTLFLTRDDELSPTRVISEKTSANLRNFMRQVVERGSARMADTKGYYVGGKTGSAQLRENGRYVEGKLRTTFIGAFPINAPKYGIIVSLNNPKKIEGTYGNTSGWNATPTAGRIIEKIAPILDIMPDQEYQQTITKQIIEANFTTD